MALYHFNVTQASRGKGQSAVACAAYRSGEKLLDEYYGEIQDYTKKMGVLHSEIILPNHAPDRLSDRQLLWNEVEQIEKHPQAQLAYSFNIALQNEFTYEENLSLARQFVTENFVKRGMIVDLAIHDPDKGDDGILNPHFHVLSPIRPINPDGTWGNKQRREYLFDENGERIKGADGRYKFNAVPTTDWGNPETLLEWRENWAKLVNAKFAEKGLVERIDHRSYENQGLDLLPTIHEGPSVRAMEKKGVHTNVGDWNRLIKKTNSLLANLRRQIKELMEWIAEFSIALSEDAALSRQYKEDNNAFINALLAYYEERNAGAYSSKAKTNNLKKQVETINFLTENNIHTIDELDAFVSGMYSLVHDLSKDIKSIEDEQKDINEVLGAVNDIKENKAVYDKLCTIKRKSASDDYKETHRAELAKYYRARRIIKEHYPDMIIPIKKLRTRLDELSILHTEKYDEYKKLKADANKAYALKKAIDSDYKKAIGIELTTRKRKDITR